MRKTLSSNQEKNKLTAKRKVSAALVGVALLAFAVFSRYGILAHLTLRSQTRELENDIRTITIFNDSLRNRVRLLQHDAMEIERLARERYGMIKPGETVYFIEERP